MTVEDMRWELMQEYPGDGWKRKVQRMPDYQVVGIFKSIRQRKEKKKPETRPRFVQTHMDLGSLM